MYTQKDADDFMDSLFEFEYCAECLGDKQHHTCCITPIGTLFAKCDLPFGENDKPHSTIAAFHRDHNNDDILEGL